MDKNLTDLIYKAQLGDGLSFEKLIIDFNPLLKKYVRKLNYEDSYNDLVLNFIKLIKSIPIKNKNIFKNDYCILGYISNSMRNAYIKLSKRNCKNISNLELKEDLLGEYLDCSIDDKLTLQKAMSYLPFNQKNVIKKIFFEDLSESYIASNLNISRQAVNKLKNKGLKNLKNHLDLQ